MFVMSVHMCAVAKEARRGHWTSWNWGYSCEWPLGHLGPNWGPLLSHLSSPYSAPHPPDRVSVDQAGFKLTTYAKVDRERSEGLDTTQRITGS